MRRILKIAVWTVVALGCAGIGAFIAAHTNPFPPGVEDPGARSTPPPPPSPTVTAVHWSGTFTANTTHELLANRTCSTSWRASMELDVAADGIVTGTGRAQLHGGLRCSFDVAQVEARRIAFRVEGHVGQDEMRLRLGHATIETPIGAADFAGFVPLVLGGRTFHLPVSAGNAELRTTIQGPDAEGDGRFVAHLRFTFASPATRS